MTRLIAPFVLQSANDIGVKDIPGWKDEYEYAFNPSFSGIVLKIAGSAVPWAAGTWIPINPDIIVSGGAAGQVYLFAEVAPGTAAAPISGGLGGIKLMVSNIGIKNGSSPLFNGGYPYGIDTPGTNTSGINEAFAFAAANGITEVDMLSGQYSITAAIIWPTAWSGTWIGQGNSASGGPSSRGTVVKYTSGAAIADMLHFAGDTSGWTIKRIYFLTGVAHTTAVLNLSNTDARRRGFCERVTVDANNFASAFTWLMDGNQDSELQFCESLSGSGATPNMVQARWFTPGGGVKVVGGIYDAGWQIQAQQTNFIAVTWSGTIMWMSGTTGAGNLLAAGRQDIGNFFGCYTNPPIGVLNVNSASQYQPFWNESGSVVNLNIFGGRYYLNKTTSNNTDIPNGTAFFESGTPEDTTTGLTKANSGFNIGMTESTVVAPGTNTIQMFSSAVVYAVFAWQSLNYVNPSHATENLTATIAGIGSVTTVLSKGFIVGVNTTQAPSISPSSQSDGSYLPCVQYVQTGAGSLTSVTLAWTDPSGNPHTRTLIFDKDDGTGTTTAPAAIGVFTAHASPIRVQKGTAVALTITVSGSPPTFSYSYDLVRLA